MDYLLPELSFIKLRLDVAPVRQAVLPPIKGSMLRGAFGDQLKLPFHRSNQHQDLSPWLCFHCSFHSG